VRFIFVQSWGVSVNMKAISSTSCKKINLWSLLIQGEPKVTVHLHYKRQNSLILSINDRKLAQQMGVSCGSTHSSEEAFAPTSIQDNISAWIEGGDIKRAEYCWWFTDIITVNGEDILGVIFFSDDTWFQLSGYVNSQNSYTWSATNPCKINDTP
jgi:hypothetical protein